MSNESYTCVLLLAERESGYTFYFCTQRFSLLSMKNSFSRWDDFLARWKMCIDTNEKMSSQQLISHIWEREASRETFVCIGYRLKCKCGCFMFFFMFSSYIYFKVATTNVAQVYISSTRMQHVSMGAKEWKIGQRSLN